MNDAIIQLKQTDRELKHELARWERLRQQAKQRLDYEHWLLQRDLEHSEKQKLRTLHGSHRVVVPYASDISLQKDTINTIAKDIGKMRQILKPFSKKFIYRPRKSYTTLRVEQKTEEAIQEAIDLTLPGCSRTDVYAEYAHKNRLIYGTSKQILDAIHIQHAPSARRVSRRKSPCVELCAATSPLPYSYNFKPARRSPNTSARRGRRGLILPPVQASKGEFRT